MSDIVGYCQILPDIVIVHCSGMMGRDSVSSEQQLEDQQWVVESRRLVADFLKENLKSGNSWPGIFVTKIQMDKYLECKLVRFPWKFIQIFWAIYPDLLLGRKVSGDWSRRGLAGQGAMWVEPWRSKVLSGEKWGESPQKSPKKRTQKSARRANNNVSRTLKYNHKFLLYFSLSRLAS